jgi:hypothetical protein
MFSRFLMKSPSDKLIDTDLLSEFSNWPESPWKFDAVVRILPFLHIRMAL